MTRISFNFGDGVEVDSYDGFGFIYLSSDNIFSPPIKEFEEVSFPEEDGAHIDARTTFDTFDYKVTFAIEAPNKNLTSANAKIDAFNKALYSKDGDISQFKEITLTNKHKRVKVVGYGKPIETATKFFRDNNGLVWDVAVVELVLHIVKPQLCDFNLQVDEN